MTQRALRWCGSDALSGFKPFRDITTGNTISMNNSFSGYSEGIYGPPDFAFPVMIRMFRVYTGLLHASSLWGAEVSQEIDFTTT